jgi:hypothetical protein
VISNVLRCFFGGFDWWRVKVEDMVVNNGGYVGEKRRYGGDGGI